MKGRFLVIVAVVAAIFAAEFVLRTDAASAGTAVSPSATPRKRPKARTETVSNNETITISGRKPKKATGSHRTSPNVPTTPLKPKKIKHYIGGSDDGSSIRPAGDTGTTTVKQTTPASSNRRKPKQDIEVENDETHITSGTTPANTPATSTVPLRPRKPVKPRTKRP